MYHRLYKNSYNNIGVKGVKSWEDIHQKLIRLQVWKIRHVYVLDVKIRAF